MLLDKNKRQLSSIVDAFRSIVWFLNPQNNQALDAAGVNLVKILLILPMLRLLFAFKNAKIFENHLNPVMLVFIGNFSPSTQMSTHMTDFQSFFSIFESFVLAKLATSSRRVKHQRDIYNMARLIEQRIVNSSRCWEGSYPGF